MYPKSWNEAGTVCYGPISARCKLFAGYASIVQAVSKPGMTTETEENQGVVNKPIDKQRLSVSLTRLLVSQVNGQGRMLSILQRAQK
jgi:hypothetical protein